MARTVGSIGVKTSDKVRVTALRLIAQKGYAAVSMREIAAEVGVQVGAIYNHFPTKQSLLAELLLSHMTSLLDTCAARLEPKILPRQALERFVRFHIQFHIDKPDEVFISYMELRNLEPDNFRTIHSLRQKYERFLRDILREGARTGQLQVSDVPVTAMAIISMLSGVNTWFRYGGRLSVEEIEEIFVAMVMQSVGIVPLKLSDPKIRGAA